MADRESHGFASPARQHSPAMAGFSGHILQRHDAGGRVARFWQSSYAADYAGLVLVVVGYILIQSFVEPFHRMFSIDNIAIQFPHAEVERVSVGMLFVWALGGPLLALAAWTALLRPSLHKIHVTFLGLFISIFLTIFLTDIIKNGVGRPRPDLISRCKPAPGTPEHHLVTYKICTETNHHTLHDGFRSFPSGHSSFAFSGLGYLTLIFASQTHVLHPYASLPALLLTIAPVLGALMIAISRCEDYRHDVWDVTAGSFIGLVIAWLTYRRYYPNLRSKHCDRPYPSRGEMLKRYVKLRDEEGGGAGMASALRGDERGGDSDEEDEELVNPRGGLR